MNIVITADSTDGIVGQLQAGTAQVHSERSNGTLRRRHFLTGKDLEIAVWVRLQREGQEADETEGTEAVTPRSMKSIAAEMHTSIAAVRRILVDLEMTEQLEDMEQDELESMLLGSQEA